MKIGFATNNLRSLDEMEPVELRPLNILVGTNSSGKSTFLRSFSLMRQSLETKTSEPILWHGDLVDFGSFKKSVRENNTDNEISFEFDLNDIHISWINPTSVVDDGEYKIDPYMKLDDRLISGVKYELSLKCHENKTFTSKIRTQVNDYNLEFIVSIDNGGYQHSDYNFFHNGKMVTNDWLGHNFSDLHKIFSPIVFTPKKSPRDYPNISTVILTKYFSYDESTLNILNLISEYTSDSTFSPEVAIQAVRIAYSYPMNELALKKLQELSTSKKFKDFYQALLRGEFKDVLEEISLNCGQKLIFRVIEKVSEILQSLFLSSVRLGPARKLDSRLYRYQALDVSEIASDGSNVPMFLYKLSLSGELNALSDWVERLISCRIGISAELECFEINVIRDGLSVNLVDTGGGISQILPVLVKIWLNAIWRNGEVVHEVSQFSEKGMKVITIEQPEIHLHPEHQARIADALVSAEEITKSSPVKPVFVVETHSEALISRLGELIEKKKISEKDVQVVLFSKRKSKPNSTEVKTPTFNEVGALANWPYGFFNY